MRASIAPDMAFLARRRLRGSLIAVGLLMLLLVGATWWVYSKAAQTLKPAGAGNPASQTP